jgi:peptidoglycan/LPS O-acetylase OafA/YrhL
MEGLRGIAILMVFVCHYDVLIRENLNVSPSVVFFGSIIGRMGTAGVDLFFLLSGFLIYRSAIRAKFNYGHFLKKRAIRIYPAFLTIFTVYVALSFALPELTRHSGEGWVFVKQVLQNLAFLPGFLDVKPIVTVAWSLSYEWYFYITAPLLVQLLQLHKWNRSTRVMLLLNAAIIYVSLSAMGPQVSGLLEVPIYRFHVRLVMFLAGMIVFEVMESQWLVTHSHLWEWGAIGVATIGLGALFLIEMAHGPGDAASIYTPRFEAIRCVVLIGMFMPITLFALGRNALLNALLTTPELRWLGNISYSYYLVHTLAINAIKIVVIKSAITRSFPFLSWVLLFPVTLVLTLIAAVTLFLLVERRFSLRLTSEETRLKSVAIGKRAHSLL